jgi:hypothetical protein
MTSYCSSREALRACFAVALCLALASGAAMAAGKPAPQQPAIPANDLVREAVTKELHQTTRLDRFMYRMRKQSPGKTELKEYVETDAGTVARLIGLNDQPLPPSMQAAEDARLQELLSNPQVQSERLRKQKEDEQRVTKMVSALADAFLYQYDGTEPGKNGELIRLRFQPNPNFTPPTRELKVFQGMQGLMWIDATTHHMARLDAKLFRDVDFGWGILGRLYKGGSFEIEQSEVGGGRWETTNMKLDFSGRELLFKSLRIKDVETLSDFHRVPDNLTLSQGIELLRKVDANGMVAQQQRTTTTSAAATIK